MPHQWAQFNRVFGLGGDYVFYAGWAEISSEERSSGEKKLYQQIGWDYWKVWLCVEVNPSYPGITI